MASDDDPLISIVTVNYNGKIYLEKLFDSILSLDYPQEKLQIIMVDNNSTDDSIKFVRNRYPAVEIVALKENRGYAGGNNEGLKIARGDYIALVNNDCTVNPDWIRQMLPLFRQSSEGSRIGAVGPKVVFYWPYIPLQMIARSADFKEDAKVLKNSRRLGVMVSGAGIRTRKTGKNLDRGQADGAEIRYLEGFYPAETDAKGRVFRWTNESAVMALPIVDSDEDLVLKLKLSSYLTPNKLKLVIGEEILSEIRLTRRPVNIVLKIPRNFFKYKKDIINSCGVKINRSLYSRDRGFCSFDDGQYSGIEEIFALSGSSFMADRRMFEDCGFFDEDFFTYYEDIDLFWRARLKGWKHFFTPNTTVRHHHCGTGKEWSPEFTYYVLRNRLLMIYKNGWPILFFRCYAAFIVSKFIHTIYHLGGLLRNRRVSRIDIPIRFKIFFQFFYYLVKFFPKRIKVRSQKRASDRSICEWFRDF
ncbi:MAG: glycosyltransferase [Actinobacteria bacterium]|nr:glycosyltransferase [Actinomycetota bacterium]